MIIRVRRLDVVLQSNPLEEKVGSIPAAPTMLSVVLVSSADRPGSLKKAFNFS